MAQKEKFKIGINNVVSWGAAVVIIGLMAKLMHWPWGDWMIIVGLGTEAFLFFLLGFQKEAPSEAAVVGVSHTNVGATAALDNLLDQGQVSPEMIGKLGDGLRKFGDQVQAISNVSDVSIATNQFADTLKNTTDGFQKMNASLEKVSHDLASMGGASTDSRSYQEQIDKLATNLAQLNAVYEQELTQSDQKMKAITRHYEEIAVTLQNFNESTAETQQLKEQIQSLNQNLASLNTVYANMLSAMNQNRG